MRKLTQKDKDAITAINNLLSDTLKIENSKQALTWKNRALENLRTYIGENSDLFAQPSYFSFSDGHGNFLKDEKKINEITIYLQGIISFIKDKGVLGNPEQEVNWFYKISTPYAIFLLGFCVTIITTLVTIISVNIKDKSYMKLEYEYKGLRDSLRISTFQNSQVKNTGSSNSSNKSNKDSINH